MDTIILTAHISNPEKLDNKEVSIAIPKEFAMELALAREDQKLGLLLSELIRRLFENETDK